MKKTYYVVEWEIEEGKCGRLKFCELNKAIGYAFAHCKRTFVVQVNEISETESLEKLMVEVSPCE